MFFAPATIKLSLEIQDLYAQHVRARIYLTCKWHYLGMLHLYINFSCKAAKVSETLVHLLQKCQLFKAEMLQNKTLEIFLPPKFGNQWRISYVCVRAFTSPLSPLLPLRLSNAAHFQVFLSTNLPSGILRK